MKQPLPPEMLIQELEPSPRVYNTLTRAGIFTVGQVMAMSEHELHQVIGDFNSAARFVDDLRDLGITFDPALNPQPMLD